MSTDTAARGQGAPTSVLHVVVGHQQPTYFLNAVRSVRAAAPNDRVLVIDNASTDRGLRRALACVSEEDALVEVILRASNDVRVNGKVGELYLAYAEALEYARANRFDLLHLLQADCQVLWWDDELVARSVALFEAHPRCVNVFTKFLSRDVDLARSLVPSGTAGVAKLRDYGLTDTGIYLLERWEHYGMRFAADETLHAEQYRKEGHEVLCHPWPTDAPIPWPAVIRSGVQRGKEVHQREPFLLQPLGSDEIARLKTSKRPVRHEDYAIPWGWLSLSPMWETDTDSIHYWVLRYRQARRDGIVRALPRFDRRGVAGGSWFRLLLSYEHRPPVWRLVLMTPLKEVWRRLTAVRAPGRSTGRQSQRVRRRRGR